MTDIGDDDDEFEPWDHNRRAVAPDETMTVLEQLLLYQHMARHIYPLLDVYEIAVLAQILDRIRGWRKHEARFSADALYVGDRMYGGLSRTMDRSRMMKALRSLEKRGLIRRRPQQGSRIRIYWVNPSPDISALHATAPSIRKSAARVGSRRRKMVAIGDNPVRDVHWLASFEDPDIAENDTGERYGKKGIREGIIENSTHPEPMAPDARSQSDFASHGERRAQAHDVRRPDINPRPRFR